MRAYNRNFSGVSDAYLYVLEEVYLNYDHRSSPRGQPVREKFNYQFTIHRPKVEYVKTLDEDRNKVIEEYSKKEFDLYNSMTDRVEDFEKASKFWSKLANKDGTVNSAYGFLIWKNKSHGNPRMNGEERMTPWEWARQALIADKDTRQAILRFSLPEHSYVGNKDFTCTLHSYFQIRDNILDMTVNMRSNDLTLGLVYDLPWFVSLMYRMKDELSSTYPDLEIGSYTHYVHNIHCYERDEEKILRMIGR